MRDGGVKEGRRGSGRAGVGPGALVRAVGRRWLRGWLEFTRVVGGGPEYLGGTRVVQRGGRGADDAAR